MVKGTHRRGCAAGFAGLALTASFALPAMAQDGPVAPPPPDWDMIVFELKSWGEPVVSWRITSQGGGSWTETIRGESLGHYTLVWHEIQPEAGHYIALEDILSLLPEPAPDPAACTDFMTDMPYGTIRLTRGATTTEIAFNTGCQDTEYQALLNPLRQANDLVAQWGRKAEVLRREAFGDNSS